MIHSRERERVRERSCDHDCNTSTRPPNTKLLFAHNQNRSPRPITKIYPSQETTLSVSHERITKTPEHSLVYCCTTADAPAVSFTQR